jgi:hypothetical protein
MFDTEPFFVPRILKRFCSKGFVRVSARRAILGFIGPAELEKVG